MDNQDASTFYESKLAAMLRRFLPSRPERDDYLRPGEYELVQEARDLLTQYEGRKVARSYAIDIGGQDGPANPSKPVSAVDDTRPETWPEYSMDAASDPPSVRRDVARVSTLPPLGLTRAALGATGGGAERGGARGEDEDGVGGGVGGGAEGATAGDKGSAVELDPPYTADSLPSVKTEDLMTLEKSVIVGIREEFYLTAEMPRRARLTTMHVEVPDGSDREFARIVHFVVGGYHCLLSKGVLRWNGEGMPVSDFADSSAQPSFDENTVGKYGKIEMGVIYSGEIPEGMQASDSYTFKFTIEGTYV